MQKSDDLCDFVGEWGRNSVVRAVFADFGEVLRAWLISSTFAAEITTQTKFFYIMKEKILAALTAISGQYNLPKEQLEKIAALAPADLTEDKITSWAESQKGTMSLMQSYADSRVSGSTKDLEAARKEIEDWKKKAEEAGKKTPETDLEKALGAMEKRLTDSFEAKLKDLADKNKTLEDQANATAAAEKERQFVELKKRVAKELGLSDKALGLLEGKLTQDMDETKVNKILSQGKKDLVEMGLSSVETSHLSDDPSEVARTRAKAALDAIEQQQKKE